MPYRRFLPIYGAFAEFFTAPGLEARKEFQLKFTTRVPRYDRDSKTYVITCLYTDKRIPFTGKARDFRSAVGDAIGQALWSTHRDVVKKICATHGVTQVHRVLNLPLADVEPPEEYLDEDQNMDEETDAEEDVFKVYEVVIAEDVKEEYKPWELLDGLRWATDATHTLWESLRTHMMRTSKTT